MTETNRRQFLASIGSIGIASSLIPSSAAGDTRKREVTVTDVGIIYDIDVDMPDGYHLYTSARDKHPNVITHGKKFILTGEEPSRDRRLLKNRKHVFRGKSLQSGNINISGQPGSVATTEVSPSLGPSTLVQLKDDPTPDLRANYNQKSESVSISGREIPTPANSEILGQHGTRAINAGKHKSQVKVTKLDEDYNRHSKFVDCTLHRKVLTARRGKYRIVEMEPDSII